MFEQTFVNVNAQTRKPWTIGVSLMVQIVGICAVLIAPLLHIAAIRPVVQGPIVIRLAKTEPSPPPVAAHAPVSRARRLFPGILLAPHTVPPHIDMTPEAPENIAQIQGVPPGQSGALSALPSLEIAPPMPESRPAKPVAGPVRVSSGVQEARLIFGTKPAYPSFAKAARVEGSVRLRALISRDGSVENLQLISGPPLLVAAAMEAIRQWKYHPTVLNGESVPVETEIVVIFSLH